MSRANSSCKVLIWTDSCVLGPLEPHERSQSTILQLQTRWPQNEVTLVLRRFLNSFGRYQVFTLIQCISKDLKTLIKIVDFIKTLFLYYFDYTYNYNLPLSIANGNTFSEDKISVLDHLAPQKITLSLVSDNNIVSNVQWLRFSYFSLLLA